MKWSIRKSATEFGVSRDTILRGLRTNGIDTDELTEFSTKQIHTALAGDLKRERTLRARADRIKAERENAVAESQLHSKDEIEILIWQNLLLPLRAELLSIHRTLAPKCTDAEASAEVLQTWVDETLKKINAAQPNVKPSDNSTKSKMSDEKA
jgi:hypothetical protein